MIAYLVDAHPVVMTLLGLPVVLTVCLIALFAVASLCGFKGPAR